MASRILPRPAWRLLVVLTAVTSLTPVRIARAQSATDSAAAQALFDQAKQLMAEGRAAEACPKLEESQQLDPGSGTLLNLGKCYEESGRFASAWTTYLNAAAAAKTAGQPDREAAAREFAKVLEPRVSKIVVEVTPRDLRGLEITRDGHGVGAPQWGLPIPADEGQHTIAARAPGYEAWQSVVTVEGPGKTVTVTIPPLTAAPAHGAPAEGAVIEERSEPAPADPPRGEGGLGTQRILALVAGGAGIVGLGVGTVFGLKSFSDFDEAEKYCSGAECTDQRGVDASDSAQTAGDISTIAFIVGGVGLAAGVTLWFTAPSNDDGAEAALEVGPGSLRMRGTF